MSKSLIAVATIALLSPAARARADESADAHAMRAASEAMEAGTAAVEAGEAAQRAAAKAKDAAETARRARDRDEPGVKPALASIRHLEQVDPGLRKLFDGAAGYAVFPSVTKAAVGVGGAHGKGVLFERGRAVGDAALTQVTVGLQLGGEEYTEVIFFQTEKALSSFKQGQLAVAAQASAMAVSAGASADARYVEGVSVFTLPRNGLMAEASVGGQKFSYHAFERMVTASAAAPVHQARTLPSIPYGWQDTTGGGQ